MDPFTEALQQLLDRCKDISTAIFADCEGEPIAKACQPDVNTAEIDTIIPLCAALGGIALSRLNKTADAPTQNFSLSGSNGHFLTIAINENYHFSVALRPGSYIAKLMPELDQTANQIRANM